MKTIGILGGMGPLATADLYKMITLKTQVSCDQEHFRVIIDSHAQIPDRTTFILGKGESPLVKMKESIDLLITAGVDVIIMPCNTAHYFHKELESYSSVPFLNMVELTADFIKKTYGDKKVCLMATKGTYQSGIYQRYIEKIEILPIHLQEDLMGVIHLVKSNQIALAHEKMMTVINQLDFPVFILGCTELSSLNEIYHYDQAVFIDPMAVMVEEVIKD